MFTEADKEIEYVRGVIATRFPVYETRVTPQAVQFLVTVDLATMEAKFEDLRKELVPKNYIPMLTREGGEHTILVQRRPPQRFLGSQVNLLLFILTIGTTMWAGAVYWSGYNNVDWLSLEAWAMGSLTFTLPLLAILGIHEMGHYIVAKRYHVQASLPFFLPAPGTLLGTFGAMISMRDPMPNRKALLDIGASGPVLGLLTAIPVTLLGFFLMSADPRPIPVNTGGGFAIDIPLLYRILAAFMPIPQNTLLHPTAFAGWVGLFVTALNLLPAGQLDGGHVARAVLGERGKYASWAFLGFMFFLGIFYFGWFIIAIFILLLGARHPPPLNDLSRLDGKRYLLAGGAAAVLLLSFVAIPLVPIAPVSGVQFEMTSAPGTAVSSINATVVNHTSQSYALLIRNVGNVRTNVSLTLEGLSNLQNANLNISFGIISIGNTSANGTATAPWFYLDSNETATVNVLLDARGYTFPPALWSFTLKAHVLGEGVAAADQILSFNLRVS
ncbi:MAG: site-2 protease family protein [Methanobacteriota archaeon]|nr:MAG: site-2 protease family protein [Euryarchaeota archaeon]